MRRADARSCCSQGFSIDPTVRLIETLAVVGSVAAVAVRRARSRIGLRLADWREPESEEEFEQRRRCAPSASPARASPPSPTRREFLDLDPYDDDDFEELVRDALDELPDLLRSARRATTSRS